MQIKIINESIERGLESDEKNIQEYKNADDKGLKSLLLQWKNPHYYQNRLEEFRQFGINYYEKSKASRNEVRNNRLKLAQPRDNDWSWIEKPEKDGIKDEVKKPKEEAINTKEPLSYIKRTGGYKIEILSPQEIVDKFGFSAVRFDVASVMGVKIEIVRDAF